MRKGRFPPFGFVSSEFGLCALVLLCFFCRSLIWRRAKTWERLIWKPPWTLGQNSAFQNSINEIKKRQNPLQNECAEPKLA